MGIPIDVLPQLRGSKPPIGSYGLPNDLSSRTTVEASALASSFHDRLAGQNKTKATIKETVNYAKRFAAILDTGDASQLLTLSPRNKAHAMTALANLAKYRGCYDKFLQMRQRYNLKWSKGDSLQYFNRFFDEQLSFDVMLQRIKEMIAKTPYLGRQYRQVCMFNRASSFGGSRVCATAK
jgi:hypothetical protein